jgi:nitroreductase
LEITIMNLETDRRVSSGQEASGWEPPREALKLLRIIKNRRSIRRFTSQRVGEEEIDFLLDAARWAPTTFQCWRFVVVDENPLLSTVIDLSPGILDKPTLVIAVCADMGLIGKKRIYPELAYQETSAATQNILLAAHALGLGGCYVCSFSRRGVASVLNLPANLEIHNLIALGYPAESPSPPPRQTVAGLTFRNRL